MSAPIVALTATTKDIDGMMRVRLNEAYVDAIRAAGLTPLVVPPLGPRELESVVAGVRGLVLTGGEDVDPARYGAERRATVSDVHQRRDECELSLVGLAREHRLPTLAICRGLQVVNVALGGTLVQDIPSDCPNGIEHDFAKARTARVHDVSIEAQSRLGAAIGATRIAVNSSHHQALARVAQGLRVTARSPDGMIEGAEWAGEDWWMLGVQWHPEELTRDAPDWDRALFRAFAAQAHRRA